MPRRGENIYKRKDGRWEGRILKGRTIAGNPVYTYYYGHSYREVKEKMAGAVSAASPERLRPSSAESELTVKQVAYQWLESKKNEIKESTYAHYRTVIEKHIVPQLGQYTLPGLNDQVLRKYVDELKSTGRLDHTGGLSAKTIMDILIIFKAVVRYSEQKGYTVHIHPESLRIRQNRKEMRVLTVQEQDKLLSTLAQSSDRRCVGIMTSLFTGLRLGEMCALKWENVDLVNQVIYVRATMQRIKNFSSTGSKTRIIITEPKSACSIRAIPIPEALVPILKCVQSSSDSFVLTGDKKKYVEPRSMENFFHQCIKSSGIAPANYHSLRHSFATRCIEAGFDAKSLSEILGHSSVNITLDRYVHSSMELKRKNMNRLTFQSCA